MKNLVSLRVLLGGAVGAAAALALGGTLAGASDVPKPGTTVAAHPEPVAQQIQSLFPALSNAQPDQEAVKSLQGVLFPDGRTDASYGIAGIDLNAAVISRVPGVNATGYLAPDGTKVCLLLSSEANGVGATCVPATEAALGNSYLVQHELKGAAAAEIVVAVPEGASAPVVVSKDGARTPIEVRDGMAVAALAGDDTVRLSGGHVVDGFAAVVEGDQAK